jgi:predicted RNase H-like nuclease (RuvC/YqgF family)
MDGKFLDVYNEVILDNFNAVLKQNFMFQTQLKFAEEKVKEVGELEKKLAALTSENSDANILREEIKTLKDTISQKEAIIQSSSNTDNERHRLQTAVNTQMKEIEGLKKTIDDLQQKLKDQQIQVTQLEEMLPNSKKKKLGIELPEEQKPIKEESKKPGIKEDDNILKFASTGGSF